jgi:hypothetical protein
MERGRREVTLGTLRALAAALGIRPGVLADGIGPEESPPLSREALERIAAAAAGGRGLLDPEERRIAEGLRVALAPRLGIARIQARRTDRAWLGLKASLPQEVIDSLVRRASEKIVGGGR